MPHNSLAMSQLLKILPLVGALGAGSVWVDQVYISNSELAIHTLETQGDVKAVRGSVKEVKDALAVAETRLLVAIADSSMAQVKSDLWAMERIDTDILNASEKQAHIRRYEILKISEVDIAKQRQKLLGLD